MNANATLPHVSSSSLSLRWSAMTHRGKYRSNNEDAFLAMTVDGQGVRYLGKEGELGEKSSDFIFAVSDGMGGARAGEFASRITVDQIIKLLPQALRNDVLETNRQHTDLLNRLFITIHQRLLHLGQVYEECEGMGATLSLLWLTRKCAHFAHVGDSRIYHLPQTHGLIQLTHDHSHVGWLRRNHKISEREARNHPGKSSLQQALGANGQFVDPQVGSVSMSAGDRFLICSDGLIDGLWDRNIEDCLRAPLPFQANLPPAPRLIDASLDVSGRDNLTALVVEVLP